MIFMERWIVCGEKRCVCVSGGGGWSRGVDSISDPGFNVISDVLLGVVAVQQGHTKMKVVMKEYQPWQE